MSLVRLFQLLRNGNDVKTLQTRVMKTGELSLPIVIRSIDHVHNIEGQLQKASARIQGESVQQLTFDEIASQCFWAALPQDEIDVTFHVYNMRN